MDLALIGALQRNSRESAAGLAAKLGTSKPTALRRTRRLLGEGVIRFVTMVNPFSLGYKGHASIGIKASPDRVKDVAEAVAALRSVQTVALCTGRYDVLAWTVFREQRDLMDSLTEEIGKIPGILSTETTISLKTVKSSYISVDRHSGLWGSLD
ncbi:MAG: Lrp/AsnC family transcriptional regulator [Chloroflexi bacterium]|nr:Lrp/AsnC family transcriptional regulator [Chloroflexota bacterium]